MASMRKSLALGLCALSLAMGVALATWGPTYLARYARYLANGATLVNMSWDANRATLPGGNAPLPPTLSPADAGIDSQALELAASYASERNTTSLLVLRRGHRVFERYFDDQREDSAVDVGEWNQLLVALSVGVAVGARQIALVDEPVANYVEEWRAGDQSAITLRYLLENSSGLAAAPPSSWPWSDSVRDRLGPNLRERALARTVQAAPGRVREVQAADAIVAALLVERATKTPYLQYLSKTLWQPIGAADAEVWLDGAKGQPRADCCLRTRAADWLRIGELLASDGVYQGEQILPPGWVRQMATAGNTPQARGWFVHFDGEYAARDLFRAEASGQQRIWVIPSLQLAIVRTGREPDAAKGWDDATIPDLIARGTRGFVGRVAPADDKNDPSHYAPRH
jgi:CubicO group peptidase (beta-lactamase class C family)